MKDVSPARFASARINLTTFMLVKASQMQRALGFGYKDVSDAPSSYDALVEAFKHSRQTLTGLPVWNGGCTNTIYVTREGNLAFRYVHDCMHVLHGNGFDLAGEIATAQELETHVVVSFGEDSVEHRIYLADTIGQSVYAVTHDGRFPEDQLSFVKSLLGEY